MTEETKLWTIEIDGNRLDSTRSEKKISFIELIISVFSCSNKSNWIEDWRQFVSKTVRKLIRINLSSQCLSTLNFFFFFWSSSDKKRSWQEKILLIERISMIYWHSLSSSVCLSKGFFFLLFNIWKSHCQLDFVRSRCSWTHQLDEVRIKNVLKTLCHSEISRREREREKKRKKTERWTFWKGSLQANEYADDFPFCFFS